MVPKCAMNTIVFFISTLASGLKSIVTKMVIVLIALSLHNTLIGAHENLPGLFRTQKLIDIVMDSIN